MHFDLQRRTQPLGEQVDCVGIHQVRRLYAVLGAGFQQPADEFAAAAGYPLELEGRRTVADLLHRKRDAVRILRELRANG